MKIKCILFGFIFLMAVYSFSSQKTLRYKTFWFGNTFSGKKVWVQDSILDIYVSKSGTIYGATIWDEGGREFGIYKNGKVIGGCEDTHGWGVGGGPTVTANKKYIFISNLQSSGAGGWMWAQQPSTYTKFPPPGYIYYGVSRYNKNGSIATFPGAQGNENQMLVLNITKEGEKPEYIEGLAADTNYLFVSNTAANEIEVFNPNTMKYIREWKVNHPERIALGNNKNLWVIQKYGIGKYSNAFNLNVLIFRTKLNQGNIGIINKTIWPDSIMELLGSDVKTDEIKIEEAKKIEVRKFVFESSFELFFSDVPHDDLKKLRKLEPILKEKLNINNFLNYTERSVDDIKNVFEQSLDPEKAILYSSLLKSRVTEYGQALKEMGISTV